MSTWFANNESVDKKWWIVDAEGQTVGRLATQIAITLRGKNKPIFTPHTDTGDFVVVINTGKMRFSGNKWEAKKYYKHTGFFGNLKEITAKEQREKDSTEIIRSAVRGMLPKNKLATTVLRKLKAYDGAEHPHVAQKPEPMKINY